MAGNFRSALQALCVMQWMMTFLFLGPGSVLLLLLLLRTRLWLIPVTYGGWWLWDWNGPERGARHWDWLRNWRIWDHFCDYFPITVVRECPLPPGRSYLLPCHPHGISCIGAFGAFVSGGRGAAGTPKPNGGNSGPCPGLRPSLAALQGLFRLPLYREYALAAGLCPVSQRCLDAVLSRDSQALLIMVGGAAEALEGTPGCHRVTLSHRRGFVRLALRHGTPLVPVYVFGEQDTFGVPSLAEGSWLRRLQRGLKGILGFAPCIFWGRGGLPLLPFRVPLTVVVGTPLEVPRVARPSEDLVAHYHGLYVRQLRELFERHKVGCGVPPETPLIIV
ncbi:2-acylglycerol O-acyltransferase 3 isoform X2 [Catharus ustulatus]|uniref:2-acylglycerol O-acyltransferase 3 isoform X1 n=1 Tax=Catharus ustulatus TaxID=91951 RepID=UPI00140CA1E2|nr:2-acylglycerol O-acyltransferase 3 isoform X1 [Catharus ustulatus]XP_032940185.1 2-acylglycerol O-acyltransferase 3 isoform X2 [Catharus ustulatus]